MNHQQIFDKVAAHLLKQNVRSTSSERHGYCQYRGDGGMMCAAGCLIPDDLYKPELEGKTVTEENIFQVLVKAGMASEDEADRDEDDDSISPAEGSRLDLILRLQEIHDDCDVYDWPEKLAALAGRFNLTWSHK